MKQRKHNVKPKYLIKQAVFWLCLVLSLLATGILAGSHLFKQYHKKQVCKQECSDQTFAYISCYCLCAARNDLPWPEFCDILR